MPTLILPTNHTPDNQRLWWGAGTLGWNIEYLNGYRVPEHIRNVEEPVIYVPALLAPTVAAEFGKKLIEPPEDWLVGVPAHHRLRDVKLISMGEARKITTPSFIKPPNDKSFQASVCVGADLPKEYPDTDMVLVQEPVKWNREWRTFILNRNVKTFSIYYRSGVLQKEAGWHTTDDEDFELMGYMSTILRDRSLKLPNAVVLDVGEIEGRGMAVIELNAAWGSGLYGCDPTQVLEVMRASMGVI